MWLPPVTGPVAYAMARVGPEWGLGLLFADPFPASSAPVRVGLHGTDGWLNQANKSTAICAPLHEAEGDQCLSHARRARCVAGHPGCRRRRGCSSAARTCPRTRSLGRDGPARWIAPSPPWTTATAPTVRRRGHAGPTCRTMPGRAWGRNRNPAVAPGPPPRPANTVAPRGERRGNRRPARGRGGTTNPWPATTPHQ